MERALVLNASHEPLGVVRLKRAARLVLDGKAEILEAGETQLHAATISIPSPLVIRLNRYVHVPYRAKAPLTRRGVLARDRHVCGYCGGRATTIDHVIPRAQGGVHRWENVAAACKPCNSRKRDRTPKEANMVLHTKCRVPAGALALVVIVQVIDEVWEPYLLAA